MAHYFFPVLEISASSIDKHSNKESPHATRAQLEERFTFPNADMEIQVHCDDQNIAGKVNSHSLIAGSPVWAKFINPPWIPEGTDPNAIKSIDCRDDDADSLLILLRITHLQFVKIQGCPGIAGLYHLAFVCEKYLCHSLLQPWAKRWIETSVSGNDMPLVTHEIDHRLIYIMWAFGDEGWFRTIAERMVRHAVLDRDLEKEVFYDGEAVEYPEKFLESIQRVWRNVVNKMLKLVYEHRAKCASENAIICPEGKPACDQSVVDTFYTKYGGIYECSAIRRYYAGTLKEFYEFATEASSEEAYKRPCEGHTCGISYLKHEITRLLRTVPDPTRKSHINHMRDRDAELEFYQDPEVDRDDKLVHSDHEDWFELDGERRDPSPW